MKYNLSGWSYHDKQLCSQGWNFEPRVHQVNWTKTQLLHHPDRLYLKPYWLLLSSDLQKLCWTLLPNLVTHQLSCSPKHFYNPSILKHEYFRDYRMYK